MQKMKLESVCEEEGKLKTVQNQCRIRVHVDGITQHKLLGPGPWMDSKANADALYNKLLVIMAAERGKGATAVLAAAEEVPQLRSRPEAQRPHSIREKLDVLYTEVCEQEKAHLLEQIKATGLADAEAGEFAGSQKKKPKSKSGRAKVHVRRDPTAAELDIVGGGFEDDSIIWKTFRVQYDAEYMSIVVLYYDVITYESAGLDEADLESDDDCVERSSVAEVKKWIKASSKGAAGEAEEGAVQGSETTVMVPSKLKVGELRCELEKRGLETSGLKAVLVKRLEES
jgi:hypothetical protein